MAMVTKMETETSILLGELNVEMPAIGKDLERFYADFASDALILLNHQSITFDFSRFLLSSSVTLSSEYKVGLLRQLNKSTFQVEKLLRSSPSVFTKVLDALFQEWAQLITEMRLRQERETNKRIVSNFGACKNARSKTIRRSNGKS